MAGQLWKPGFSSGRNSGALRLQGLEAPGRATDLLSSGQERPRCPGPSRPLPVPGEAGSWAVSRRPVLRSLRWWIRAPGPRSPLRGAAARAPPSFSWNRAAPSARSLFLRLSPPELLRVPPCALQPLGSSAQSPGAQVSVSVPGSPRASPPSWVLLHLPASPFPPGRSVQRLLLRDGALLSWGHSPRP